MALTGHSRHSRKDHRQDAPALPAGRRPWVFPARRSAGHGGCRLCRLAGHRIDQYAHLQQCGRLVILALMLGDMRVFLAYLHRGWRLPPVLTDSRRGSGTAQGGCGGSPPSSHDGGEDPGTGSVKPRAGDLAAVGGPRPRARVAPGSSRGAPARRQARRAAPRRNPAPSRLPNARGQAGTRLGGSLAGPPAPRGLDTPARRSGRCSLRTPPQRAARPAPGSTRSARR